MARRLNAGDSTQVFIDGAEIVIGHILKCWPRHHLEQRTVEGTWEHGVKLIGIDARYP